LLCPRQCLISEGKRGNCLARVNRKGVLIAESYGKITSLAVDPVTKKPFNRYYPDNTILTVASYGCNLHCKFCQNHHISQRMADYTYYSPEDVLRLALTHTANDNIGLAFSYNEPGISYEYVEDCFELIKKAGLKTLLVTNGYLNPEAFQALAKITDAVNMDLKAFNPGFYRDICGGSLDIVMENLITAAKECHLQVTTLVVPGLNDSPEEMKALVRWLGGLDPEIPFHISRFFPRYKMTDVEATPIDTIDDMAEVASEYLRYIYLGNI
ncbi:MAG: AmmeMemoRadiSam system radical SAM enzyme, partial [Bacillota bacterium]|nr:AmmeMemoRadiSam system radical SAM enzyme [Bacillota bacterium]